jgi:Fe2+ or Zn2+ uptake regulation protein
MSGTATEIAPCSPNRSELTQATAAPAAGRVPTPAPFPAAAAAALQRLRALGHRGTPACRYILQQLATTDSHLSADELFASLPAALTGCDRSTIHRQLTQLQHAGVIHAIPGARAVTFGLLHGTAHDHESCLRCGQTIDTPRPTGHVTRKPTAGFLSRTDTNVVFGVCTDCPTG